MPHSGFDAESFVAKMSWHLNNQNNCIATPGVRCLNFHEKDKYGVVNGKWYDYYNLGTNKFNWEMGLGCH